MSKIINNTLCKTVLATALVSSLIMVGTALAHEEHFTQSARSPQKAYEFRTSTMTIFKWYLSPMGAMLKGKTKFNVQGFARYAKGLETAAKLNVLQGFPKESSEDDINDSSAKPEIWENSKDFASKYTHFQDAAKKLASIAEKGDKKAIVAQFKITAGACSACHKKYKTK